jgi:NAD(P)-dependent dehydrogenase (short-subunit alcohol dehydrogenase family)
MEFGVRVNFSKADIAYADDVADMIDTAESEFGHVDILVNNARNSPAREPTSICRQFRSINQFA